MCFVVVECACLDATMGVWETAHKYPYICASLDLTWRFRNELALNELHCLATSYGEKRLEVLGLNGKGAATYKCIEN